MADGGRGRRGAHKSRGKSEIDMDEFVIIPDDLDSLTLDDAANEAHKTHNSANKLSRFDKTEAFDGNETKSSTNFDTGPQTNEMSSYSTIDLPASGGFEVSINDNNKNTKSNDSLLHAPSDSVTVQSATRRMGININLDSYNSFYSTLTSEPKAKTHNTPVTSVPSNTGKIQDKPPSCSFSDSQQDQSVSKSDKNRVQSKEIAKPLPEECSMTVATSVNSSFGNSHMPSNCSGGFDGRSVISLSPNQYSGDNSFITIGNHPISVSSSYQFGGNSLSPSPNSCPGDHITSSNFQMPVGTDTREFLPQIISPNTSLESADVPKNDPHLKSHHSQAGNIEDELRCQNRSGSIGMNKTVLKEKTEQRKTTGFEPNHHLSHLPSANLTSAIGNSEGLRNEAGTHCDLSHQDNTPGLTNTNSTCVLNKVDMQNSLSRYNTESESDKKASQIELNNCESDNYPHRTPPIGITEERSTQSVSTKSSHESESEMSFIGSHSQVGQFRYTEDLNETKCKHIEAGFNDDAGLFSFEVKGDNHNMASDNSDSHCDAISLNSVIDSNSNVNPDGNSAHDKDDVKESASTQNSDRSERDRSFNALKKTKGALQDLPGTRGSQKNKYSNIFLALDKTTADMNRTVSESASVDFTSEKNGDKNKNKSETNAERTDEIKEHSAALTIYDCQGGEPTMFSAFLCVAPEDVETFGLPFLMKLKSWGFRVCFPSRDLILTGCKLENLARVIRERCNRKVIVIVSKDFPKSDENLFMLYFAKQLDLAAKQRSIIPIYIDKNIADLPNVLSGLSSIQYNQAVKNGFLRTKVSAALALDTSGILNIL